jgi:hypothetical protein
LERLDAPKSLGGLYITANALVYDLFEKVSAASTAVRKPVHLLIFSNVLTISFLQELPAAFLSRSCRAAAVAAPHVGEA